MISLTITVPGAVPSLFTILSVGSVVGFEIEGVTYGCEGGSLTATSAVDILDHHCAEFVLALPQFVSVGSVVSFEIGCCQQL